MSDFMTYEKKVPRKTETKEEPPTERASCYIEVMANRCIAHLRAIGTDDFATTKANLIQSLKEFKGVLSVSGYTHAYATVEEMIADVSFTQDPVDVETVLTEKQLKGVIIQADAEARKRLNPKERV